MRIPVPTPLVAALAIAAIASPGAARDRNDIPAATTAGKAQSCIPLRSIRETLVRSDRIIDFRMLGNKTYRVTMPQGCPGLNFERRFAYATSLNQLCQQDIITVLQQSPMMRGASCGLAEFQPVTLTK